MKKRAGEKAKTERSVIEGYDYSTAEARVETAGRLFSAAKSWRAPFEADWRLWDDYYNFLHRASMEFKDYCEDKGMPWVPATVPDPYIQVESQIIPTVPEPEFRGRDDDMDSEKAKIREFAVHYVCQANRIDDMNTSNERRLVKLGDAWWKAYWDKDMRCGSSEGDIRIKDIPLEDVYPDPSVGEGDFQQGQFLAHVYRLHKVRLSQIYAQELRELGLTAEELAGADYQPWDNIFDNSVSELADDMVQILEFWYRNPIEYYDGSIKRTVPAGAVCCSIQAGDHELRHIPLYWRETHRQCDLFPFVHYWRIRDETHFYNKSELFAIKDLVDAADRKLGSMLLNDAMMSNDIIVAEEGAFADGCEPENTPGSIWLMKPNKAGAAARLGGLSHAADSSLVSFLSSQIQRTSRNYDTNLGQEASRQTTATGLALLRDDANSQAELKKADRLAGFERLFELLDWLCLEFYTDNRLIYLGAKNEYDEPRRKVWDSSLLSQEMPELRDPLSDEVVREGWSYYPRVDVTVSADDGVIRGKQATLSALDKLVATQVNEANWKLLLAELDLLDLPQKKEIGEMWKNMFAPAVPNEITQALAQDGELLQIVRALVSARGQGAPGQMGGGADAVSAM